MKKLNTIQKREKLNDVYVLDEKGNGGAHHIYMICKHNKDIIDNVLVDINFQNGPRNEESLTYGILDTDLLEIVRHRLQCFQSGPYSSRENACALTHIEEALMWLNRRVEDRIERNVLGTNNK
ncbi:ABC transporter ATPase [Clostridium botulinum]|nr:ABC transporter ATPase [Clostridium botulinum]NFA10658.1 ABC transporter ATPase [Clostridium botulinum]NFA26097.1 ABC transporter ATPase [Clostridium botulinum]